MVSNPVWFTSYIIIRGYYLAFHRKGRSQKGGILPAAPPVVADTIKCPPLNRLTPRASKHSLYKSLVAPLVRRDELRLVAT